MKIITLNCYLSPWSLSRKERLPYIVSVLVRGKADVIFLQEVFFSADADYIIKKLLQAGFVDFFYSKTLLIVSKYYFISEVFYEFRPRFNCHLPLLTIELLNWLYGKGYQAVEIEFNNQQTILVNTHLLSAYGVDNGVYSKARLRQLLEIYDYIKDKLPEEKQMVLGGDFNFDFNSPSYKLITDTYGFDDPFESLSEKRFSTTNLNRKHFWLRKMNQRIDHIFTKGFESSQLSGQIIFKDFCLSSDRKFHISDHYGLGLEIK